MREGLRTRPDPREGTVPVPDGGPDPLTGPFPLVGPDDGPNTTVKSDAEGLRGPRTDTAGAGGADADLLEAGGVPPRRWNRAGTFLALGLAFVVVFGAGAAAQRQRGGDSGAPGCSAGRAGASRSGSASGQFPGAGGFGRAGGTGASCGTGSAPDGAAPSGCTSSTGTGSTGAASNGDTPAVVGTVISVSGTQMKVKNFGGTTVTVTAGSDVTVTSIGPAGIGTGTTVSVTGTVGSDGRITASAVVARSVGQQ